jgi:hypothetical protein
VVLNLYLTVLAILVESVFQQLVLLSDLQCGDALACVLTPFLNKSHTYDDGGKGNMCCLAASTASLSTPAKQ